MTRWYLRCVEGFGISLVVERVADKRGLMVAVFSRQHAREMLHELRPLVARIVVDPPLPVRTFDAVEVAHG